MRFVVLIVGLSWIPLHAATRSADPLKIEEIARTLTPLPDVREEYGTRRFFRTTMEELVENLHAIAQPERRAHKLHKSYLFSPTRLLPRLVAQAELYEALQRDLIRLGKDAEHFGPRRTFYGRDALSLIMDIRLELAGLMQRSYFLPRLYLEQFDAALNKPLHEDVELLGFSFEKVVERGGLVGLLKHSGRARSLVARVSDYFKGELEEFDKDLVEFVWRIVHLGPNLDITGLDEDLTNLKNRFEIFENRLQYMVKNVSESLSDLVTQKKRRARDFSEVAQAVEALGRGLKSSAMRAEELRPSYLSVHTSLPHSYASRDARDGTILMDVPRELYLLFAGGGNHFTQHALPPNLKGEDGRRAIEFFNRALVFQYVLAVGVEIERASQLRLSLPALKSRLRQPTVQREDVSQLEDQLWAQFFAASGLSEQKVCQSLLE